MSVPLLHQSAVLIHENRSNRCLVLHHYFWINLLYLWIYVIINRCNYLKYLYPLFVCRKYYYFHLYSSGYIAEGYIAPIRSAITPWSNRVNSLYFKLLVSILINKKINIILLYDTFPLLQAVKSFLWHSKMLQVDFLSYAVPITLFNKNFIQLGRWESLASMPNSR